MEPLNLDLNLLVLFEAVFTTGNVGRAAQQLGLTPPAASNGLTRLRKQLGDPLFTRTPEGMIPTPRARQLIGAVREALGLLAGSSYGGNTFDLATYQREFNITMIDALEPVIMPPVLRRISERAPGVTLELIANRRGDLVLDLRAGTIDMGIYTFPYDAPDIVTVPLGPSDVVVVARRGHPGIGKRLDAKALQKLPHVGLARELRAQTNVPKDLAAHDVDRRILYAVSKVWAIPWMVEQTDLIAFLPRRFAETVATTYAIEIHESPVPIADQHLYLMWHERHTGDPGHKWLRDTLIDAAASWREPKRRRR
jgi:DNA-binding transcriptional LysR family regulator